MVIRLRYQALKSFIQHTGYLISSRMAEKALNHIGELDTGEADIDCQ